MDASGAPKTIDGVYFCMEDENTLMAPPRIMLLAVIVFGIVGTGAELALLGHTEDLWQWIPLVLLALSVPAGAWLWRQRTRASVHTFQGIMVLFLMSGMLGLYLHYRGNVEFELEMYPSLSGLALFRKAVTGATPTLAPGAMIFMGLLGLICTYRTAASPGP